MNSFPLPQTSNTITPILQNSQFQIQNPPSTTITTNPHFHNTSTTSFTNTSKIPTYNTVPPSTISHNTISHPTYINSFVQAFKKQFSSEKNAYYAQVEALNLTKKDNETVRHFALKVQQLVENAGVLRTHPLFTSNVMKFLQKDFPKTLKTL